jgi:hypothetical protein
VTTGSSKHERRVSVAVARIYTRHCTPTLGGQRCNMLLLLLLLL